MRTHKENRPGTDSRPERTREAEIILARSLNAARDELAAPVTPLAALRSHVESQATRQTKRERRLMNTITKPLSTHRKLSFGVVFATLVVALVTLVPFEYQQTIGYDVTFATSGARAGTDINRISEVLGALGYDDVEISVTGNNAGAGIKIASLPSRYAVREVIAAMNASVAVVGEAVITPVIETVSGSIYAQAVDGCGIFDLGLDDIDSKTNEEIKAEIEQKLVDCGVTNATVKVSGVAGSGERKIVIAVDDGGGGAGSGLMENCDVNILEGIDLDDPNKTDEELADRIRAKLAENGAVGMDVVVSRGTDGERKVMICAEKTAP